MPRRAPRTTCSSARASTHIADERVADLAHGQQRQLEIGMALAGAPRLILFDEPAAGLSPAERRELVALLRSLPTHMSFVLIEHDLDIALRVVERVTVMHNGRVLRTAARRDRERRAGAGHLHGEQALMAWFARDREKRLTARGPVLAVEGLDVYYGRAHALQGVSLTLERGVLGIVGRNGMGKTTLCNAITGLVPAQRQRAAARRGDPRPRAATRSRGAASPTCRRVGASGPRSRSTRRCGWSRGHRREVERVYAMFPRLAERRGHGGAQLSGGEQQMLAIGRALLLNPRLLVMDEPTEGLAPVIVEQVAQALRELGGRGRDRGAADRAEPRRRDRRSPTASA